MKIYTFIVDPSGRSIQVPAEDEGSAHRCAWLLLTEDERDRTASLECIEIQ